MNGGIPSERAAPSQARWLDQLGESSRLQELDLRAPQGPTLKDTRSSEALAASKAIFTDYVNEQFRAMTAGLTSEQLAPFRQRVDTRMTEIIEHTFGAIENEMRCEASPVTDEQEAIARRPADASHHLRTANEWAQQLFKEVQLRLAIHQTQEQISGGSPLRPQLLANNQGTYSLVRRAPQIENLVLAGGGGKGVGLPPALREMERVGMLTGLKQVVGSSVGALTAVCIAAGQTADELSATADKVSTLLKTDKSLRAIYPDVRFAYTGLVNRLLGKEANGVIAELDKVLGNKVAAFIKEQGDRLQTLAAQYAARQGVTVTAQEVQDRLQALATPDYGQDRTGHMVTFSDLRMLHALAPERFKEAQLTGENGASGVTVHV